MDTNLNINTTGESKKSEALIYEWLRKIDKSLFKQVVYHKNELPMLIIEISNLVQLLNFLKNDDELRFKVLADIVGIDYIIHNKSQKRFSVIYNLLSIKHNLRIFLQIFLNDDEEIPSVHEIFKSATWLQREVYDMFGIRFSNALDHRRILTDYGFQHFPLRKDFPLTGYEEVRYDSESQSVKYSPVELDQDFRDFDFEMPWEAVKEIVNNK